jgi:hypothetical protein
MVSYQVNPFLEVAQRRAGDAYLARSDRLSDIASPRLGRGVKVVSWVREQARDDIVGRDLRRRAAPAALL